MALMAAVPIGLLAKFKIESLEYLLMPNSNSLNTLGSPRPLFERSRDSIAIVGRSVGSLKGTYSLCLELNSFLILSSFVKVAIIVS